MGERAVLPSLFGSAEGGLWAVMNPAVTGCSDGDGAAGFICDTRDIIIVALPRTIAEDSAGGVEPL